MSTASIRASCRIPDGLAALMASEDVSFLGILRIAATALLLNGTEHVHIHQLYLVGTSREFEGNTYICSCGTARRDCSDSPPGPLWRERISGSLCCCGDNSQCHLLVIQLSG